MNILLSVFACAPNTGSETGVGWRWAVELARAGHNVVAITDETRRSAIDAELSARPVPGLRVEYFRPAWLRAVTLNSRTAQLLFSAWQYWLVPRARELHAVNKFDVAIHLTYGVFRTPCFLGRLGIPLIFGPVGGGEDAPWSLKRGLPARELMKELVRTSIIKLAKINPFLIYSLSKSTLILTKTDDTRLALPGGFESRAANFHEIGIDLSGQQSEPTRNCRNKSKPLEILFAGRLLGWKGVHLVLKATAAALAKGRAVHLTIVGSGPLEGWLKKLAADLGLGEHVTWHAQMSQQAFFQIYKQMHCFLFPSLHDSSGNVVLEALSFGLPVVCLNIGGPATLVDESCAHVIAVQGASQAEVVEQLAVALCKLSDDEGERLKMSAAAQRRAASMTWASRPAGALSLLTQRVHPR